MGFFIIRRPLLCVFLIALNSKINGKMDGTSEINSNYFRFVLDGQIFGFNPDYDNNNGMFAFYRNNTWKYFKIAKTNL